MLIVSIFGLRLQASAHEIREADTVMHVGETAHA